MRSPSSAWMGATLSFDVGVSVLMSAHLSVTSSRRSWYLLTFTLCLASTSSTSSSWSRRRSVSFFTCLISKRPPITLSRFWKLAASAAVSSVRASAEVRWSIWVSRRSRSLSMMSVMNFTKPYFSPMASGSMLCTASYRTEPAFMFMAKRRPLTREAATGAPGGHRSGSARYSLVHSSFCVSSTYVLFTLLLFSVTPPYSISWLGL
mmetsp:Transcript_8252/g.17013  ORF Transcript_8252/g.17013 Transcript_8252/m.17013 type:complete len:206 (-) Transcript_8252:460-1077(-)